MQFTLIQNACKVVSRRWTLVVNNRTSFAVLKKVYRHAIDFLLFKNPRDFVKGAFNWADTQRAYFDLNNFIIISKFVVHLMLLDEGELSLMRDDYDTSKSAGLDFNWKWILKWKPLDYKINPRQFFIFYLQVMNA